MEEACDEGPSREESGEDGGGEVGADGAWRGGVGGEGVEGVEGIDGVEADVGGAEEQVRGGSRGGGWDVGDVGCFGRNVEEEGLHFGGWWGLCGLIFKCCEGSQAKDWEDKLMMIVVLHNYATS